MTKAHQHASSGAAEQRKPRLLSNMPPFPVLVPKRLQAQTHTLQQLLSRAGGAAAALLLLLAIGSLLVRPRQPPGSPVHLACGKQQRAGAGSRPAGPGAGAVVEGTRLAPQQSIWRRPTVLLLGDSLTESGLDESGWTAALAKAYRRKVRLAWAVTHGLG